MQYSILRSLVVVAITWPTIRKLLTEAKQTHTKQYNFSKLV